MCKNKPKFGGDGNKKKACLLKFCKNSLAFMPHPLPLVVSKWVPVQVMGFEQPLVGGKKKEPDIATPDANRIAVQVMNLLARSTFNLFSNEIGHSWKLIGPQVTLLTFLSYELILLCQDYGANQHG